MLSSTLLLKPFAFGLALVAIGLVPFAANAQTPIRVNAGGPTYTDPQGLVWAADTGFTGGSTYIANNPITGTDAQALYQSERYGAFQYQFAVPNGAYQVRLRFAELYVTGPGQRVFNVGINGQTALGNFDVFAQAGGAFRAIDRLFPVTTSNGQIVIQFAAVTENPQVTAIEIVPQSGGITVAVSPPTANLSANQVQQFTAAVSGTASTGVTWSHTPLVGQLSSSGLYTAPSNPSPQTITIRATSVADTSKFGTATVTLSAGSFAPIRVNAGGPAYTDPQGLVWAADTQFSGGATYTTTNPIAATDSQPLFQSERYGVFQYLFPVPNGTYQLRLRFAEIYLTQPGQRVFNVSVNGQTILPNFDIFVAAGGAFRAIDRTFAVSVTNGQMLLQFSSNIENPTIGAIEIVAQGGGGGVSVAISPTAATLTPNTSRQFTATVAGASNTGVSWSYAPQLGVLTNTGLYTAPASVTSNQTVTVTATSLADPTKSASATVTLTPGGGSTTITWNTGTPAPIGRMEAQGIVARDPRDNREKLYVFGGFFNDLYQVTPRSDAYDPSTNTWTQIADTPELLTHSAVVADGNTIYLVGAYVGNHPGGATTRVYKYNITTNTWSDGPRLPAARGAGAAAIVGRNLHFIGGATRTAGLDNDTDQIEHWVLALDGGTAWVPRRPIPTRRNHIIAVTIGGKIYVPGGQNNTNEEFGNLSVVEVYDPPTDTWTAAANMPTPRGHLGAAVLDGRMIVVGGTGNSVPPVAEVASYNPATNAWTTLTPIPDGRATPIVGAINGRLIVASGADGIEPNALSDWQASRVVWNGILSGPLASLQALPELGWLSAATVEQSRNAMKPYGGYLARVFAPVSIRR